MADKKIPADILAKIGQPNRVKEEGIAKVKYDFLPNIIPKITPNNILQQKRNSKQIPNKITQTEDT